jgi:hypothetical protein
MFRRIFQGVLAGSAALLGVNVEDVQAQVQMQEAPVQAPVVNPDLEASAIAAQYWLQLMDAGRYTDSWSQGAKTFQLTISQSEWDRAMNGLRKPLGSVLSRQLAEQRTAKDPKGLPAGDYMVLFYRSSFQNRPEANELVTMVKESDGVWRVLTYQHN